MLGFIILYVSLDVSQSRSQIITCMYLVATSRLSHCALHSVYIYRYYLKNSNPCILYKGCYNYILPYIRKFHIVYTATTHCDTLHIYIISSHNYYFSGLTSQPTCTVVDPEPTAAMPDILSLAGGGSVDKAALNPDVNFNVRVRI